MRFAGAWTQTEQRLNGRICQRKARRSMVQTELVDFVVNVRQFVIGKKKGRIALHCVVEQLYSFEKIFSCLTQDSVVNQRLGVRVMIVRGEVRCGPLLDRRLFARRDFGLKLRHDFPGNLTFDCEYIRNIAIITVSPKVAVCPRIDQLSVDAHPAASTLYAAFQHVCHAKRLGDLAQVSLCLNFVLHCRCATDYFQVRYLGQAGKDFVLHAIREVGVLSLSAQIPEWKNGYALVGNCS